MIKTLGGWLVYVMREADGALSLEESLHVVMDSMKAYFPCQSVAVLLIDDDTKELRIKISRQISYTFAKKFRASGPSRTAEQVVLRQQPVLLNHVDPASETYADLKLEHDFTSAVLAPVVKNQRGVGYIFCDRADHDAFTESDLLHLQVMGYIIGHLIEKFELIRDRKKLSQVDDASGALQYKAFVPMFATELQRARSHGYPVVLALLSIGVFRKYVEMFGIDKAHALLAEVVTLARETIRDMDLLARFAADELILCLSGVTAPEAERLLQTIGQAVSQKAIGQGDLPIELTIGALALTDANDMKRKLQDILGAVGHCLVEAKSRGTNRLTIRALSECVI